MARKDEGHAPSELGRNDLAGLALLALTLLVFASLISYDPRDVSANSLPANPTTHNWVGPVGAWLGYGLILVFGLTAFLVPLFLFGLGLGYIWELLAYLRRRWLSAVGLILASAGLLDLYNQHFYGWQERFSALPGGLLGKTAAGVFGQLGIFGATTVFLVMYVTGLYGLTDLRLGYWLREWWQDRRDGTSELAPEEKQLQRRARDLERQARALQQDLDQQRERPAAAAAGAAAEPPPASPRGIGADLQPVPQPTVRDLSIPTARATPAATSAPPPPKPAPEPETELITPAQPSLDGDVIPAAEVKAATVEQILGRPPAPSQPPTQDDPPEAAEKSAEIPPSPASETPPPTPPPSPRLKPQPRRQRPIAVAATPLIGDYKLPTLDFLQFPDPTLKPTESKEDLMANARLMQQTLAQFDIEVALGDITKGPTITRYELHPAPGVKLERITGLNNNIAAALKAERIHILAPVPGKSSVGVEVPNAVKTKVIMRDLLESEDWQKSRARIPLALGKDVYGQPMIADLAEMPHLLIAGSTGSGKSVCINAIVASLLYRFAPDQLRFVMIDPKVVELQQYNGLPHLVVPVVTDPKKVVLALRWVVNEMEKRYQIFAKVGVRNIKSFNERPKNRPAPVAEPELPLFAKKEKIEANSEGFAVQLDEEIVVPREDDIVIPDKLSYVVVIIDELADLMLVAPADVEMAIARITQMARAAGIHCIVATQRPSVDVITGVIKANIPARIAFQVASKVDSRTILDAMGADKLLGKGDMLYLPPGSAKLIRAQGVLITDNEIQSIVDCIKQQGQPSYEMEIHQELSKPASSFDPNDSSIDEDESLIEQCIEVIRSEQKASVSLLQRRLRLGYTRAARIMDELESRGIVGPSKGAEPRDILIDLDAQAETGSGQAS